MTLDEAIKQEEEVAKQQEEMAREAELQEEYGKIKKYKKCAKEYRQFSEWFKELKHLKEQTRWIPVNKRLPENTNPVNITWVNHNPVSYYVDIKDKPFVATGHYCNGKWWWYSAICQDLLDEYGESKADEMDDEIEVIAWMPLLKPYQSEVKTYIGEKPYDDCISRQAVLDAMRDNYRDGGRDIDGDYVEGNYSEKLYDAIMSLSKLY